MTQRKNNATNNDNRKGFFAELLGLVWLSAKAALSSHTITNRRPLIVKGLDGKHVTIRNKKFQKVSSILWMVIASVNMLAAFGMPFQGMMYGSATAMKYFFQDTEMIDMMAGIIWDLNAGLKDYLIQNTWVGGLLDTLCKYNVIQLFIIVGCTAFFLASVWFLGHTISKCRKHMRTPYFNN